ncbi:hypothetical protein SeLEV6574_g05659 [Synchytrium endobioticum]|uniref:Helicase C-terminal domain-containing protein n=1 Tax=Synchytrium endobioticum TaxID=286115 RepID=A0A507CT93_9FUNG|nr:hypothetical protein SeLEV6574_g05659 [Synchytrium endobioticum]
MSYGKIKLLLQHNRYYVESRFPAVLEKLLRDDLIKEAVLDATLVDTVGRSDAIVFPTSPTVPKKPPTSTVTGTVTGTSTSLSVLPTASSDVNAAASEWADQQPQQVGWMADVMNEDADTENTKSFEIDPAKAEQVCKRCSDLTYPMLEEYDFRNDRNPNTKIDLRPSTLVRPYQAKALSKMFGNGRARSGIIYYAGLPFRLHSGFENFIIGQQPWMQILAVSTLKSRNLLPPKQCAEVWCNMTPEFYKEYLRQSVRKKQLLYAMNPRKIQACQYLIERHEQAGDKIIVFSDNVFALKRYANKLGKPYIYGGTSQQNRLQTLSNFRHNPALNTIFLSKIGDTSIDIPEATVLIQISSHYGSRRQEAQRLGRILRAKRRNDEGVNAFFYTLVSKDTIEMVYSGKRQQFLIDQGYSFKVVTNLDGSDSVHNLVYSTKSQQIELLTTVLIANDTEDYVEMDGDDAVDDELVDGAGVIRRLGDLNSLSGADFMAYMEYSSGSAGKRTRFRKYQKRFD